MNYEQALYRALKHFKENTKPPQVYLGLGQYKTSILNPLTTAQLGQLYRAPYLLPINLELTYSNNTGRYAVHIPNAEFEAVGKPLRLVPVYAGVGRNNQYCITELWFSGNVSLRLPSEKHYLELRSYLEKEIKRRTKEAIKTHRTSF